MVEKKIKRLKRTHRMILNLFYLLVVMFYEVYTVGITSSGKIYFRNMMLPEEK